MPLPRFDGSSRLFPGFRIRVDLGELSCLTALFPQFVLGAEPVLGFVSFWPSKLLPDVVCALRNVFVSDRRIRIHGPRTLLTIPIELHQGAG